MWFNDSNKKNRCCTQSDSGPRVSPKNSCHEELHRNEKKELTRLLEETGEALPTGGAYVIDHFLGMDGHISPENLREDLKKAGHELSIELINAVLELLCRYGIAQRIHLGDNGPRYEHLHLGLQHDHLLCTKCGKVVEFNRPEFDELVKKIAKEHDFKPLLQKTTILGLCSECKIVPNRSGMPLSIATNGERLKVERLVGGCEIRHRLTAMGLSIGDEIEVISNCGPIIINVKGSRLAIGRGFAQKIIVSQLNKNGN